MKIKIVFLLFVFASGCNISRNQEPMVLDPPEMQLKAEDLDFKTVSKFVFKPSCVGCHKTGGSSGGVNLETHENVFKHVPQIKLEVAGGLMPPKNPLSQLQMQVLNKWIDAGAKEFAGSITPLPPSGPQPPVPPSIPGQPNPPSNPQEVPFSVVMEKVFKISCVGCHSGDGGNMGNVNLENYEAAFQARTGMEAAIKEGRMPPSDMGLSITPEQKGLLLAWLNQGAKP